jgi:TolB protein
MKIVNIKTAMIAIPVILALIAAAYYYVMFSPTSNKGGVYSPDGTEIAFFSTREGYNDLWIMKENGEAPRKVTTGSNNDRWPQYSADGKTLAFISNRDGDWEAFTVNTDGSSLTQVTKNDVADLGASLSPDGRSIAVGRINPDAGFAALFIMNRDGKNPRKEIENAIWPQWSRDGKTILHGYTPASGNGFDIWAYNVATKERRALTKNAGNNFGPRMSMDGEKIIFVSDRDGAFSVFEMNSDGSNQHSLNIPIIFDGSPDYSPDGRYILFSNTVSSSGLGVHNRIDLYQYEIATRKISRISP